jgi:hypothetical protein
MALTSWINYARKIYQFKIVALTRNKGRACDVKRNPISQNRGWGFSFGGITIRYPNPDFISYSNMISDKGNNCNDLDLTKK